MTLRIIFLATVILTVFSCRNPQPYVAMDRAVKAASGAAKPDTGALTPAADEVVTSVFVNGRARNFIHKDSSQTVYLSFDGLQGKTLRGNLYSKDPKANIRISQIILPDGSMDGPFGWDITYDLPESGTYRLAIHENMMAGNPWEGDFKVELAMK